MENENKTEEFKCENCRDNVESLQTVAGMEVCEDCASDNFFSCDNCGNDAHTDESVSIGWCETVCESCYSDHYFSCNSCGDYYRNNYYGGNGECQDCHNPAREYVHEYGTDVLDFTKPDKESRLFGVELEVGCDTYKNDVASMAEETVSIVKGNAILAEDGSISTSQYDGFEIITRPMNFDNQTAFWTEFDAKKPEYMRSWELGTCGLHVHTSRKPLTALDIGKILVLVNGENNRDFMHFIARRKYNSYAQYKAKKITDGYAGKTRDEQRQHRYRLDKYDVVNLSKEHTIEFRMFRGSTRLETILTAIEFVDTVLDFVRETSIKNLDYQDFIKFAMQAKKKDNLKNRIKLFLEKEKEKALAAA